MKAFENRFPTKAEKVKKIRDEIVFLKGVLRNVDSTDVWRIEHLNKAITSCTNSLLGYEVNHV
jgi:hypothetical protein